MKFRYVRTPLDVCPVLFPLLASCIQAQLVVAQRGYARAEAEATKARALLRAAEAEADGLEAELSEARAAAARARAETESLRQRSRVVLQEARDAFSAEQVCSVCCRC